MGEGKAWFTRVTRADNSDRLAFEDIEIPGIAEHWWYLVTVE